MMITYLRPPIIQKSTKSDIINSGKKIIMKIYSDARKCDSLDS